MGSNLRTREAIMLGEGEGRQLHDIIEAGSVYGWHSFEQSLFKAYEQDLITDETALLYCTNKPKMVQRIDAISLKKPRKSSDDAALFANLKMQEEAKRKDKPAPPTFDL